VTRWLPALILLAGSSCAWWQGRGRVYTSRHTHVGIRPALECGAAGCDGAAVTIQVSDDRIP